MSASAWQPRSCQRHSFFLPFLRCQAPFVEAVALFVLSLFHHVLSYFFVSPIVPPALVLSSKSTPVNSALPALLVSSSPGCPMLERVERRSSFSLANSLGADLGEWPVKRHCLIHPLLSSLLLRVIRHLLPPVIPAALTPMASPLWACCHRCSHRYNEAPDIVYECPVPDLRCAHCT